MGHRSSKRGKGLSMHKGIAAGHARKQWRERQLRKCKRRECPVCKRPFNGPQTGKPTVDHIIPLSKGGKDSKENWQLMCYACNLKKGDKIE